jgi:S-adenosylmethionine:tRNA ribosyltransferase-isomerase
MSFMSLPDPDLLSSWQFHLPPELVASRPAVSRDDSRLLIVDRSQGTIRHSQMRELPTWLNAGDVLVFNNTKVLPARLFGFRTFTGGRWEGLYIEADGSGNWYLLCETRGRLTPGETITVIPAYDSQSFTAGKSLDITDQKRLTLTLLEKCDHGGWLVQPSDPRSPLEVLEEFGSLPLPPYMGRRLADPEDQDRYQTEFASEPGAVAAPTAGLHFTERLLRECRHKQVASAELTLHVGIGTFRPVVADRLSDHQMHEEWCRLPVAACQAVAAAKQQGGRLVAVGTTSVRTLESAAITNGLPLRPWEGRTRLFIRPGHRFQAVDLLLTNFHLPGSTLLVLVAALAGYELIMEAYRQAIEQRYRFYSYGDAMLIL